MIGIALTFGAMIDRVSVHASSVVLAEQGWRASFSTGLHEGAIEKEQVYIADREGNKVDAEIELYPNGRTIEVEKLAIGEYVLHIQKDAFKGVRWKTLESDRFPFSVQEELTAVGSEKNLRTYFGQVAAFYESEESGYGATDNATDEAASESSSDGASIGGGSDHSMTNQQVEDVDEADLVKTDGNFIYSISDEEVMITDISEPAKMKNAAELSFDSEFYPSRLFLSGDTLIVLGSRYKMAIAKDDVFTTDVSSAFLYDISDPAAPILQREIGTDGYMNSARLTGNVLYMVTNVYAEMWRFEEFEDAELRPSNYDSNREEQEERLSYDRITILPGALESSYTLITALDLSDPDANEVVTEGFLGSSEQLYMNKQNLYLTAPIYESAEQGDGAAEMEMWMPQQVDTEIFKFGLNGAAVDFIASGRVEGHLLNQFSMDEYGGYFRVVTTEGSVWDEKPSKNHLFVLDDLMAQVGSVEDLAPGERIYSARFMEGMAYMVTFRETDPLFVIDVSKPTEPVVLGELKIPGFSNYLHPLDEDHLIGFGFDTKLEPNKDGGAPRVLTGGMKISLFDVSDFHNPREKDIEIIGGRGTYSPLHDDHRALLVHQEKNLFGFPVILYEEASSNYVDFGGQGAMLYSITRDGIELAANLVEDSGGQYEDWEMTIQRLVYSGDYLYAVANGEVSSYTLGDFEPVERVRLGER